MDYLIDYFVGFLYTNANELKTHDIQNRTALSDKNRKGEEYTRVNPCVFFNRFDLYCLNSVFRFVFLQFLHLLDKKWYTCALNKAKYLR